MKLFGYLTIICLGLTIIWSCSGKSSGVENSSTPVEKASVNESVNAVIDNDESDSIAMLYGSLVGNDFAIKFAHEDDYFKNIDRKDFVRGISMVINSANRSASYTEGVSAAIDILKEIENFTNYNVTLDRERVVAAIERRLRADSITEREIAESGAAYNILLQRIYSADAQ